MAQTSAVFTPAKLPTYTDVDRKDVSRELDKWAYRGGYFLSVLGATKLGKTTLVQGFLSKQDPAVSWHTYLSGQSLQAGAKDLWDQLARELEIPTSKTNGFATSDRKTWGVLTKLKATIVPGSGFEASTSVQSERESQQTTSTFFNIDTEAAAKETIVALLQHGRKVFIAIDDFHFIHNEAQRKEIALALRPLTDKGATVILSTIPGGQKDNALSNTNLGGRRKSVEVRTWNVEELSKIAEMGFKQLSLTASSEAINKLAQESFGSPQIMQSLCLEFCETVNSIFSGDPNRTPTNLNPPADWDEFFKDLEDDEAIEWLKNLTEGPNPRKTRRKYVHPGPPQNDIDGYQAIMLTLHELGAPTEVPFSEIKSRVATRLGLNTKEVNNMNLELKAQKLSAIGSRDTHAALGKQLSKVADASGLPDSDPSDEDEESLEELLAAEAIPQPVFELSGEPQKFQMRILDPLLAYMTKWHPEIIIENGR